MTTPCTGIHSNMRGVRTLTESPERAEAGVLEIALELMAISMIDALEGGAKDLLDRSLKDKFMDAALGRAQLIAMDVAGERGKDFAG